MRICLFYGVHSFSENLVCNIFVYTLFQITNEPHMSSAMFHFDYMVRNFPSFSFILVIAPLLAFGSSEVFLVSCLCRDQTTEPNFNLGTVL